MESSRVDRWLWAIRLFPTRSAAAAACTGGHVRVGGKRAKPASSVKVGDTVHARVGDRQRVIEVVRLLETRVGAPIAVECYVDHSPPPEPDEFGLVAPRDRGAGRPSKRDRRDLERARGRRPR